ncbi:MAG: tetratricopeptide repeat protein, partial [Chitinispirillaceae bacterium]|nr:tetratricopeptide repeat protein [Chitinispirillaceae bacterium]
LFIKIGTTLGERLLFTPSLGFCMAAVFLFSDITSRLRFRIPLAAVMMTAVMAACAVMVVKRNTDWKDNYTLVSRDIVKNPASAPARHFLGALFLHQSRLKENEGKKADFLSRAIAELRQSIAIYPEYALSWYLLGNALNEDGRHESAIAAYRKTIELQPEHQPAANNTGVLYFRREEYDSAAHYFRKALSLDTTDIAAQVNLGAAELLRKNYGAARASFTKVIERDPHNKDASLNLYRLALLLKDTALARQYRAAAGPTDRLPVK